MKQHNKKHKTQNKNAKDSKSTQLNKTHEQKENRESLAPKTQYILNDSLLTHFHMNKQWINNGSLTN